MSDATGLHSLFLIMLIAAAVPLIVRRMPGPNVPEVVLLLISGILIGPHVLGWATFESSIDLISNVGLGMLFFLAGFELERAVVTGVQGKAAAVAWAMSMCISMAVVGVLAEVGFVRAFLPVSIALTTTALGTLVPILRDAGIIRSPMGRAVMANGAIGELFPIIAISVFLSTQGTWAALGLLAAFGIAALALARIVSSARGRWLATAIRSGAETSSQTTVRFSVLLLVALLAAASRLGLDVVLGAFAGGIVLRIALPDGDRALENKLDGLGYGFFIPAFFVISGMNLDVGSVIRDPARVLVFFGLMLAIRGLPVVALFWRWMPGIDAVRLGLYAATGLPLIVAITQIALQAGVMRADNAAALVGAGLLTVIFFPMLARVLPDRAAERPTSTGPLDDHDVVAATE